MTVCVTGGRTYNNTARLNEVLDRLHAVYPIDLILQGRAAGADMLAQWWARRAGVHEKGFQAQWDQFGKRAGHVRNRTMLLYGKPDLVVAFPGGPGTRDCVTQANELGIWVLEIDRG